MRCTFRAQPSPEEPGFAKSLRNAHSGEFGEPFLGSRCRSAPAYPSNGFAFGGLRSKPLRQNKRQFGLQEKEEQKARFVKSGPPVL